MFTGLIQSIGAVKSRSLEADGLRLRLEAPEIEHKMQIGDSLAVNGVCLSLEKKGAEGLQFFASTETLEKTNLSHLEIGFQVNLELPLQAQSYLGGHWVQGHVDARARLVSMKESENLHWMEVEVPERLLKYFVEKGSVCIEGVSLTINSMESNRIQVCIIPETWKKTNFPSLRINQELNIEVDVLAKYVERQLEYRMKNENVKN